MMRPLFALTAALLAGCPSPNSPFPRPSPPPGEEPPIEPGTETVSASWDVDLYDPLFPSPTLPRFDTLDGQRQLDGMTIEVDHALVVTAYVENGSDFALTADDYSHEFYFQSIIQLGVEEEPAEEGQVGPPFFGPGAFQVVQAVDLAAADGIEGSGDDFHEETVTQEAEFEGWFDRTETEHFLEAMTGTDDIQLVVGGFSESFVWWADDFAGEGLVFAGASALQYSGTITVTYEYSPVGE